MHIIEPYRTEIRLISNLNGLVGVYPDYESFLDSTNYAFIERHVVTTFRDWPDVKWWGWWRLGESYERFVVRDKFGSVFSPNEILNDFTSNRHMKLYGWSWKYFKIKNDFIYRQTPVPWTGNRRGYFKSYYKFPKTTQERKWSYAYGEYVRGKRRGHILPNTWDDRLRGDVDNRKCWKNKKIKRQWMKNTG